MTKTKVPQSKKNKNKKGKLEYPLQTTSSEQNCSNYKMTIKKKKTKPIDER